MASLSFGLTGTYSAPALQDIRKHIHFTEDDTGWFGALATLGAVFGGLVGGQLVNWLGRKGTLLFSTASFTSGYLFIIFGPSTIMLFAGRFLTGVGIGIVALAVPVFISEICPANVRGLLNAGSNMVLTIGNLIVFVLGKWLDYKWLAACCLAPSVIMAATLPWCNESPRWLLQKGRRKAAMEALQFYVGTEIEKELETLEASISNVEVFSLHDLTLPHVYRPFLCTLLPMFMQQFSAICIILFFANDIFAATGTSMSPEDCTIIVGVIQVAVLLVATLLIDRLGRKVLLLFSTAVTSLSLVLLGLCFDFRKAQGDEFLKSYGWLPLAVLSVYFAGFSMGLGPLPWVILGEMLPLRVKGFATGICTAFGFSCGFVVVKEYHDMQEFMGTDGTYWMFGAVIAACFFAVLFFVPETKGKSLEEIEHLFQKASSFEDTKRSNGAAVDRLRA
ncbi:facilitated trehalose transporter Tret1-like [Ixodes scapularis]|uniref:facilitated trehalose transporter Tret1-like n=1 Tax=Ixodes scapularis TaxID=6945 RepID=UPI001A9F1BFA|nr:facilitated trehalose transporter Tret1-like [Ixodes scapularis]